MVEDIFKKYSSTVEDLRHIADVKFFAVTKMDMLTDRWSLLFGLTGVKDLDKREKNFSTIREIIIKHLDDKDMQDIARIGLFATTDHLISDLIKYSENERIENVKANGNFIHEGYILISTKAEAR